MKGRGICTVRRKRGKLMKKALNTLLFVVIGLFAFVACTPQTSLSDELVCAMLTTSDRTRAITAGVDFDISTVKVWKYTAEKADNGLSTGTTTEETVLGEDGKTGFLSQGSWNFWLYGYDSVGNRTCSGYVSNAIVTVDDPNVTITVTPNQTADGKGTIIISDDIRIVGKDGTVYTEGDEYTRTITVYKSGVEVEETTYEKAPSGLYSVKVVFTATPEGSTKTYKAAEGEKTFNVYDNLTTVISGTIEETATAAHLGAKSGVIKAEAVKAVAVNDKGKNTEEVKLDVASTPTGKDNSTTVSFPAGSLDLKGNAANTITLTVETAPVEIAAETYTVSSTEQAGDTGGEGDAGQAEPEEKKSVVAAFDFNLTGTNNTTFEKGVTITTYITKGLDGDNLEVKYDGEEAEGMSKPKVESYDPASGELVFTVYHFSTYYLTTKQQIVYDEKSFRTAVASGEEEIRLVKDLQLTEAVDISRTKNIDLNGNTLRIDSRINLPKSDAVYTVTVHNGDITGTTGGNIFQLYTDSSLVLENVDMNVTAYCGIFLKDKELNAQLAVRSSDIYVNGAYGIGTNATEPEKTYVSVILENSKVQAESSDDDNTAVLINVPATVSITGCEIIGERQGLILRGADTVHSKSIINTTIRSTSDRTDYSDAVNEGALWGSGNSVPLAALVIGDNSNSYKYGTTVELGSVTLSSGEGRTDLHVYQDGEQYPVTINGKINGEYTSNDAEKRGGATVNLNAEAKVGSVYYTTFKEALEKAADGATIEVLSKTFKYSRIDLTQSVTINANGADFNATELDPLTSMKDSDTPINIVVNDAKNIKIWGGSPKDSKSSKIINIKLNRCTSDMPGYNMVMLQGSYDNYATWPTLNLELNDCEIRGINTDANCGVFASFASSVKISNCTFTDCIHPVNIANWKGGKCAVEIINCTFTGCGTSDSAINSSTYSAPIRLVNKNSSGELTARITGTSITKTKGNLGDVLLVAVEPNTPWYGVEVSCENNRTALNVKNTVAGDFVKVTRNATATVTASPN